MTDTTYVRLTEKNDWEGETWHFYLSVADNQAELNLLRTMIRNAADDSHGISLSDETFTEEEVDTLVRNANSDATYMPAHTKIDGKLCTPSILEDLYKGQIVNYITARP